MESRESTLISRVDKQQEQIRQLERKLKQAVSEQEHLSDHNTILTTEIDKFRRECDIQKEEVKRLRKDSSEGWRECEEKKQEIERLQKRIEKLKQLEKDFPAVREVNRSLRQEIEVVHAHYESVVDEKAELEHQNSQTMMALNEEREEKAQLEIKLREDELRSPISPSWAMEKAVLNASSPTGRNNLNHNGSFPFPSPTSPSHSAKAHSTPRKTPLHQNLLSEMLTVDTAHLELLQKLAAAEETAAGLRKEKAALSERVSSLVKQLGEVETEATRAKEELNKRLSDGARAMESLKEDQMIKDEILDQLRNKLTGMAAERTSMEIEVEAMKNEVKRVQESSAAELERYRCDCQLEQEKNLELRGQVVVLEEQSAQMLESLQKLEGIIYNSHNELSSMTDDIHNMHRAVVSLVNDNKTSASSSPARSNGTSSNGRVGGGGNGSVTPAEVVSGDAGADDKYYTLQLKERKSTVQVHLETQSLVGISNLHDQLRSIRSPLEQFTKKMLEKSLAHSTRHLSDAKNVAANERGSPVVTRRNTGLSGESDVALNKWRSKLAVKTEEVNNLRAIMRARAATTEVSVSSLRSKIEGQSRAYQTELTKLKYQLRMLKKEKEEQYSQRVMYYKRCEDLSEEITRTKRDMEGVRQENTELLTSLKKTIQKKLDLSRELEEYKVEQERLRIIPARLGSSRI
ncbi:Protein bicaudal D homolog 1 [Geodia barretti]|nr:Protein bicaudal D homolog 1 [Geodia barretti]